MNLNALCRRHHLEQDAAELKLLLADTQAFLAHFSSSFPGESVQPRARAPVLQPASSPIDFKQAFATAATIQGTLRGLLEQIHAQLEQKPPLTHEEALAKIQSMWKLRKARKQLKALVGEVYASFQDPTTGQTYYYNKQTKQTQWTKPLALGKGSLPDPNAAPRKAKLATKVFASREEQELHAVAKLQAMARTHFARRHMRKLISSVYEKIWDAGTQRFYYHNTKTKEVKWEKPRWVNDEDLTTPRTRYEQLQQEAQRERRKAEKLLKAPPSQEEAARMVQRAYRRKTGFQNLLKLCRAVYERIYDPETERFYYHNTRTRETTWEKPLLLRGAQSDVFTPRTREKKLQMLKAAINGKTPRKLRVWSEEEAATRLQGLYRAKKAKEELGARLVQRFKQAIDPSSGQVYYVDLLTQEVSWDPPALLLRAHVQIETFE
ncbi:hypothetical protein BBJ28_00005203 [Nothophytophthora sp. Chile5]|nr:hypothetical protein BBJ28_00005203 [Nothophytophthora sp. Chile5]